MKSYSYTVDLLFFLPHLKKNLFPNDSNAGVAAACYANDERSYTDSALR